MATTDKVQFDPRKFTWLGSSSNFSDDAYVMIVRNDAPVKSIEEMRRADGPVMVLGGTADGATGGDVPRILQDALGLNMKLVLGYRDSAAVFLAMERDEVSGRTTDLSAIQSSRPDWLKPGGGYRLLVQYARRTRHPNYPDVPTARELATTEAGRALIEFTETPLLTMARPFAAPPGVPPDLAQGAADGVRRRAPRPTISRRGQEGRRLRQPGDGRATHGRHRIDGARITGAFRASPEIARSRQRRLNDDADHGSPTIRFTSSTTVARRLENLLDEPGLIFAARRADVQLAPGCFPARNSGSLSIASNAFCIAATRSAGTPGAII